MNKILNTFTASILFWSFNSSLLVADPEQKNNVKPVKMNFDVSKQIINMPGITIDRKAKEVSVDAEICLTAGILEYVVCKPDTFEHESIFTTKAKPELIHASLILLGMKEAPMLHGISELWAEKAMKQKESRVKIEVEWTEKGKKTRVNLTSLLRSRKNDMADINPNNQKNKAPVKEIPTKDAWIFAGSFLHKDKQTGKTFYAANSSGIIVGIWPDNSTVVQYGIINADPHKGRHNGYEIHEKRMPKNTTNVKLIFSHLKKTKKTAKLK